MEKMRGRIVSSKAGHDKGCFFVIVADEFPFAFICDGKRRPLDNPKRKNPVHLVSLDERLNDEAFRSDRALRKALAQVRAKHNKE